MVRFDLKKINFGLKKPKLAHVTIFIALQNCFWVTSACFLLLDMTVVGIPVSTANSSEDSGFDGDKAEVMFRLFLMLF